MANFSTPFELDRFDPVDLTLTTDASFEELMSAVAELDTEKVDNVIAGLKESGRLSYDIETGMEVDTDTLVYNEETDDSVDMLDMAAEDYKEAHAGCEECDDDDGELIDAVADGTLPVDDDLITDDELETYGVSVTTIEDEVDDECTDESYDYVYGECGTELPDDDDHDDDHDDDDNGCDDDHQKYHYNYYRHRYIKDEENSDHHEDDDDGDDGVDEYSLLFDDDYTQIDEECDEDDEEEDECGDITGANGRDIIEEDDDDEEELDESGFEFF